MKNIKLKNIPYRYISTSADRLSVRFEKDKLKEVTARQNSSYFLEVIKNGAVGTSSTNQLDEDELIDKALKSSEFGDKINYDYPKSTIPAKLPLVFSQKVADVKPAVLIELGKSVIEQIKEYNPKILVDVSLGKAVGKGVIENSSGLLFEDRSTDMSVYADGELVSEGDILQISEYFSWGDLNFQKEEFAKSLIRKFKMSEKIVPVKAGSYDVIFTPDALTNLIDFVETALNAHSVYKKVSKWQDDLGNVVVDKRFSLIDNPTLDFCRGTTPIDDEGVAASPMDLIKGGVLKNFFNDLKNSQRTGQKPNGHGFGVPASPGLTNIFILPGDKETAADMLKNMKQGILIDQCIGGGQDSPYSGDFSLNIHLGYLIVNGECAGRIKNCMISGNIFEMLKSKLMEISSDTKWIGSSINFPHMSFTGVNIIGGI